MAFAYIVAQHIASAHTDDCLLIVKERFPKEARIIRRKLLLSSKFFNLFQSNHVALLQPCWAARDVHFSDSTEVVNT